ncbi:glycoside hydrolase family 2 TIM barrel-domain containing protein [Bacteroidota bacterium]
MNRIIILILFIGTFSANINSQNFKTVPALSPPVDSLAGQEEWEIYLDGPWKFNPQTGPDGHLWDFEKANDLDLVDLPSVWYMDRLNISPGDTAGYYYNIWIPPSWEGHIIKLRFDGVYSQATVFTNGFEVGEIKHPFTSYEFDITELVAHGLYNMLYMRITSGSLGDSLSNASYYAAHDLGGIHHFPKVFALPDCHFTSMHVRTRFDSSYNDAWMIVDYTITNPRDTVKHVTVDINMADTAGNLVYLGMGVDRYMRLKARQTQSFSDSFLIESPIKWDPEHPVLYELRTILSISGELSLWSSRKFGFRQIEVRGNQVYVNNMPIKLHGVNRHDIEPYAGRLPRVSTMARDLSLFKKANINYIRTSHYPPSGDFLDLCDKLGFFVEVEAPFCWAHTSMADGQSEYLMPPAKRYEAIVEPTLRMVNNFMSHPSVLMWSLGNESKHYKEYFRESARAVKQLDPYRPLVFSSITPDSDMNELEIGSHHLPGPDGPSLYSNTERPIVFDAYAHLYTYNHRELVTDPGLRDLWGEKTAAMWEEMYQTEGILGGAIWSGIDEVHISYGYPIGFGAWGILDIWRRTKPEYWHVNQIYSPVRISKSTKQSGKGDKLTLDLENRHDFTNLKECRIEWKYGEVTGFVEADIPPRSAGQVSVDLPGNQDSDFVDIRILDPRGKQIQQSRFYPDLSKAKAKKEKTGPFSPLSYEENESELFINSAGSRIVLDKKSGLFRIMKDSDTLVFHSPGLMILPLTEDKGKQLRGRYSEPESFTETAGGWKPGSVDVESTKKNACLIRITGKYNEATGSYTYEIRKDGIISVSYDFSLDVEVSPRQVGLVFDVNDRLSTLLWERKGFWSYYPPTHIGRISGEAKTNMELPVTWEPGPVTPPKNIWELDRNDLGSNDFRSTRTRILRAGLGSADGKMIEVISDGTQAVRAWHSEGKIRLLIADFNDGGYERLNLASVEKEKTVWQKGTQLTGRVQIRFNGSE